MSVCFWDNKSCLTLLRLKRCLKGDKLKVKHTFVHLFALASLLMSTKRKYMNKDRDLFVVGACTRKNVNKRKDKNVVGIFIHKIVK